MRTVGAVVVVSLCLTAGCARLPHPVRQGPPPSAKSVASPVGLSLAGEFIIPTGATFEATGAAEIGGLSGCVYDAASDEVLVVSDGREPPRFYTLKVRPGGDAGGTLTVVPLSVTYVQTAHDRRDLPFVLDFEGITIAGGDVILSSEGENSDTEGEQPAVLRFDRQGRFRGSLEIPDLFLGGPADGALQGMRENEAFESLTSTPDGLRLITGAEGPLRQDDNDAGFDRPVRTRLLEMVRTGREWRPARQLVYELEPVKRPPWSGPSAISSGLVDLVALEGGRLLSLERSFVRERGGERRGVNGIRLFEIDTAGADDVSTVTSLRERPEARPVGKRLVLDVDDLRPRLGPELQTLENFEAMCEGPRFADGGRSLLLVSDNNFSANQRTAFLIFRMSLERRVAPGLQTGPTP